MLQDFRFAYRSLLRTPGFTLVAVLMLGLGLGTTATVASWIERVLLNPLPGTADPDRLVAIETLTASGETIDSSDPDRRDYAAQSRTLSYLVAFKERALNLGTGDRSERVWAEFVSANFFTALGVRPLHGRLFEDGDRADQPGAESVVVIGEHLWRQRFAADPKVIGRTIHLNRHEFTVIGVAPAAFPGTLNGLVFDLWVPLPLHPRLTGVGNWLQHREARALHLLARLAPGITHKQAQAELTALAGRLAEAHPDTNRGIGVAVYPVAQSPHGAHSRLGTPLVILSGACVLLLLVVCANLANLLYVRATARQREMCIRLALGAGRGRLLWLPLAETLLLAAAGTALALLCAVWSADLLQTLLPSTTMPVMIAGQLDWRVFALVGALATLVALAAGLMPSLWTARTGLVEVLRSGRGAGVNPAAEFRRGVLVAAQVAVALVAIACTCVAAKSFHRARHADPGFNPQGVLLAALKLDASGYTRAKGLAFLDRLQQRLTGRPGIGSVAFSEEVPLGLEGGSWFEVRVPGYVPASGENMKISRNLVSPGYFELMRIPLLAGRDFTADDDPDAPLVAIVNETFARRYFGSTGVVGRTFGFRPEKRPVRIVGIVADSKYRTLTENARPFFYLALRQHYWPSTGVAVHIRSGERDLPGLLPELRHAIRELDPGVPLFAAITLDDYISAASIESKAIAHLLGPLSVLSLGLAALGLYGVLAFSVAQRMPEIGVRVALGARASDIEQLVLKRGLLLTGLGVVAGLFAARIVTRLLAHALYGIEPSEPALLFLASIIVATVTLLAAWLPARRAARVDPMVALRAE